MCDDDWGQEAVYCLPKWLQLDSTEDDQESKAKVFFKQQCRTIGEGYKELNDNLDNLTSNQ